MNTGLIETIVVFELILIGVICNNSFRLIETIVVFEFCNDFVLYPCFLINRNNSCI